MNKPLVILTGPTAAGKTALSLRLAKTINGEIISADSMQVYRGMDIGTAKIKKSQMDGIPHHLIDILPPAEEFNIVKFKSLANKAMDEIYERNRIPIICGGTGFYIQSVLYDIDFKENDENKNIRERLVLEAKEKGARALHDRLKEADPEAAVEIHENNIKRVIRALEFFEQTGKKISAHNQEERTKASPYQFAYFVLNRPRDILYERINKRVDQMMEEGLLKEVEKLYQEGFGKDLVSMQGIGYKEILSHLNGECTLEEAVYILKRNTRHFAKRQITWFKRERDVIWLNREDFSSEEEILDKMLSILNEKKIPGSDCAMHN